MIAIMRPALVNRIAFAVEALVVVTIIANIAVTFSNAVVRYLTNQDFPWASDVWTILISIITFLGAPAYFRRGTGMAYTALIDQSHGVRRQTLQACGLAIFLGVCGVALAAYPAFFAGQLTQTLQVIGLSSGFVAIWLGLGLLLFCLFALEKLIALERRAISIGVTVAVAMALATFALRRAYDLDAIDVDPFLLIVPALIIAFITGVPIAGVLALAGLLYFVITAEAPITTIPSAMQYGVTSFILLAVPFFMVAGTLIEASGMARRMIDMVQEWVGHWTGGLLVAEVLAMYVFSGLSGSKAADIATVGGVMKTPLRHYGYPPTELVAVLAASAAMGETIPPSLMLLVLGSITSLSVGSLFLAGLLPAAILALVLIAVVIVRSHINGYFKGPPFRLGRALRSTPPAIPAFLVPVIVVGGIIGGIASPTEFGDLCRCVRLRCRSGGVSQHRMAQRLGCAARCYSDRRDGAVHGRCLQPGVAGHRDRRDGAHAGEGLRGTAQSHRVPARHGRGDDRGRLHSGRDTGDPDRCPDPAADRHARWRRSAAIWYRADHGGWHRRFPAAHRHRLLHCLCYR